MKFVVKNPQTLQPNPAWASLPLFDRTGWKRMAFGAFAESIGERAEPKDAQEEIYVGLEHLDPQCLHIRSWGKGSDVTGTKLRFRKGDIIFGRRRAYQRKLAVAEFDGICSAHAMVVRARPDKVLPQFLPFLMMSDRFMNRAVEISVGSLSPTINWTTLKLEIFSIVTVIHQNGPHSHHHCGSARAICRHERQPVRNPRTHLLACSSVRICDFCLSYPIWRRSESNRQ